MSMTATAPTTQRPLNAFERTTLEILDLVAARSGVTVTELYKHFGERAPTLPLDGNTLHEYMEGLMKTNYLVGDPIEVPETSRIHFSYTIASKGENLRADYRQRADQKASS